MKDQGQSTLYLTKLNITKIKELIKEIEEGKYKDKIFNADNGTCYLDMCTWVSIGEVTITTKLTKEERERGSKPIYLANGKTWDAIEKERLPKNNNPLPTQKNNTEEPDPFDQMPF